MPGVEPNNLPAARPGTVLCGKYRVERALARGGMGVVVVATHLKLDRLVAIKLVDLEGKDRAHVSARFLREARAAGRLVGEHVVRILDLDEAADGTPFLVMELLEGTDLERLLIEQGRVAPARAVDWALQACAALAEAHARDIVHRDVKPANLFLVKRLDGVELIKLLDFGISKIITDEVQLTRTAATLGSPLFMSPEQLLTPNVVDRRSDVWSLGVTLYRWLAGAAPFDAADASGLAAQIAARPPTPLSAVVTGLPEGLSAVVMRCLEKDAALRFSSVLELADGLEPFRALAGLGSTERVRLADAVARSNVFSAPAPVALLAAAEAPPSWTLSHDVPVALVSGSGVRASGNRASSPSAEPTARLSSGSGAAAGASGERVSSTGASFGAPLAASSNSGAAARTSGERLIGAAGSTASLEASSNGSAAARTSGERLISTAGASVAPYSPVSTSGVAMTPRPAWLRPALLAGALALSGGVVVIATSNREQPAPAPVARPTEPSPIVEAPVRVQPEAAVLPEAVPAGRDAGTLARVRPSKSPADPRDPADLELK